MLRCVPCRIAWVGVMSGWSLLLLAVLLLLKV